ncbi:MAG TPA: flagellar filament capping protein FliD [Chloroflexota bacterium]|nr:flagellar filament capping protein FliD [Chloroflexota bacterium]
MSTPVNNSSSSNTAALLQALLGGTSNGSTSLLSPNSQPPVSFGGLVSGLSTQSLIQGLMAADQAPLTLLQGEQTTEQNKLKAWQDIQTKLQTLQNTADTLSLQATTGAKTVDFSGPSGTYATGIANAAAANGSFSLTIQQIATQTSLNSTTTIGQAISGSDIATLSGKLVTPVTAGTFTIDNTQIAVTAGDSFQTILNNIQSDTAAAGDPVLASIVGNTIQLTRPSGNTNVINLGAGGDSSNFLTATKLLGPPAAATMTSTGPVGTANPGVALDSANIAGLTSTTSGSLAVNGVTINYNTATDTLQNVLDRINASSAGVSATYNAQSDTVTFLATQSGSAAISVSDGGGNLLASLNLTGAGAEQYGNNAEFQVNGGALQYSTSNTVNNIIPGVNLTLAQPTPTSPAQPVTVTIKQDPSVGETAMQGFVSAYNAVVDTLATDTAYDSTNNTAGLLLGDPTAETLQQQLDTGLFIQNGSSLGLPSGFTDVTAVGLNTGPIGSTPGTTTDLHFDTTTFESAMNSNPSAVTQLVTTVMGGFHSQLMNITQPFGQIDSAIQGETSTLQDLQTQISDQQQFLQQEQASLNDEFTQMETMLAQIESQASSGTAALTSLNNTAAATAAAAAQASTTG